MGIDRYEVEVNGLDISGLVDVTSYHTTMEPVFSDTITTIDGVDHVAVLRLRGTLTFAFNSLTAAQTAAVSQALLTLPATVRYHCLQRKASVVATMRLNGVSAQALARIRFGGAQWNEVGEITFTEL